MHSARSSEQARSLPPQGGKKPGAKAAPRKLDLKAAAKRKEVGAAGEAVARCRLQNVCRRLQAMAVN